MPSSLTVALALRSLVKRPGYVSAVVLTLALGIGMATAMFSAVAAVLLSPLGIVDPERVVVAWGVDPARSSSLIELTYNDVAAMGAASPALASTAAVGASTWPTTLEGAGDAIRLQSAGVSGAFFELLQVRPAMGRLVLPRDDIRGGPDVVVLSHATWQRLFGGDSRVLGRTVHLDTEPATVIGVAPPEFDFPRGTEVWRPLAPLLDRAGAEWRSDPFEHVGLLLLVARLRQDAALTAAAEQLTAAGRARDASRPVPLTGQRIALEPLLTHLVGPARQAIIALFAAVIVLLLVACANVSGLMLTQASRRAREDAVQIALGAGLPTLVGQRLIEGATCTIAGGALGLVIAHGASRAMLSLAPEGIPRLANAGLDLRVLAFAATITAASMLLVTVAPIRQLRRLQAVEGLGDGGRSSASRRAVRTRAALLVLQTGLAVVLLVAAGVLVRSFEALRRVDVGFQAEGVVTVRMDPRVADTDAHRRWMEDLLATLRTRPHVRAAGGVYLRPMALGPIGQGTWVLLEGQPETPGQTAVNPVLNYQTATPDYFRAMGIALLRGRLFTSADDASTERVVVVSAGTAARLWPGQDPIGKRLLTSSFDNREGASPNAWRRVVGVVADVRYRGLDQPSYDLYDPAAQSTMPAGDLVVRTDGPAVHSAAMILDAVRASRAEVVVHDVQTLDAILARAMAPWRFAAWVFSLFGSAAFLLALLGLASVVSLGVAQRRHEFAIRLALGAPSADIARRAAGAAALRVGVGLALGLVASSLVVTALRGLLFGIPPFDWATYAAVPVVVVLIAALAAAGPVYRALRINPATTLRRS